MSEFKLQITTKAKNAGLFILRKGKRRARKRKRKGKSLEWGQRLLFKEREIKSWKPFRIALFI